MCPIPNINDVNGIIGFLHKKMGRIPNPDNVLRFMEFLKVGNPTEKEAEDFINLLVRGSYD